MSQFQIGKEVRGLADEMRPKSQSQVAVAQISDQIVRLIASRDRLEFIRDRLVGRPQTMPTPDKKKVAEVAQDTLVNDLRGLTNGLSDTIEEVEILLREIEEFV